MTTEPIAAGPNDVTVRAALEVGIAVIAGDMAALAEVPTWEELQRFAALVAAAEREACATTVDRLISGDGICADSGVWIHDCAEAIRGRSNAGIHRAAEGRPVE